MFVVCGMLLAVFGLLFADWCLLCVVVGLLCVGCCLLFLMCFFCCLVFV